VFEGIFEMLLVNLTAVVLVSENGMSWEVMVFVDSLTELN
jgi:hypothetical protein